LQADDIIARGKSAAAEGNRQGAEAAIRALTNLRDTLRQVYSLRVVSGEGEESGFWRVPEVNTAAANYYIVVEPVTREGDVLSLPIQNEETNQVDTVSKWGVRVPQAVYNSVEADKRDDGIIQRNLVGGKQEGFLEIEYVIPVLGGAVTQW
jgi:hypothetical protein